MGMMEGKVAVITGAASGQGAAEARLLASAGARVVIADIDEGGKAVAEQLGAAGLFIRLDVAEEEDWNTAVQKVVEHFGRLDVLVNNAAVFKPQDLNGTSAAMMDLHYRVNQRGVFLGMRTVVPIIQQTGGGAIVNVSSVAGLGGTPGIFAYATTKWAVRGMTRAASAELSAKGIRVNTILPGIINTPMLGENTAEHMAQYTSRIPMGRLGSPEEVARLVLFLASDEASYITGAEVVIGGGLG